MEEAPVEEEESILEAEIWAAEATRGVRQHLGVETSSRGSAGQEPAVEDGTSGTRVEEEWEATGVAWGCSEDQAWVEQAEMDSLWEAPEETWEAVEDLGLEEIWVAAEAEGWATKHLET